MKNLKLLLGAVAASLPLLLLADSETDNKIETTLSTSYNFRTVLDNKVKVQSRDGVVTLSGTVLDREQKTLAEDTARDVPGVVSVDDQLKVSSNDNEHSDGWIALKVRSSLLVHANVSASDTHVDVHQGVVTLSGKADNEAQKELTEVYAGDIEGVKSVKNNMLVAEMPGRSMGDKVDDISITTQVKYALLTHHSTSAVKTSVATTNGVVVIKGEAGSDAEKDLVTKLARNVRGVASVNNEMTVRGNE